MKNLSTPHGCSGSKCHGTDAAPNALGLRRGFANRSAFGRLSGMLAMLLLLAKPAMGDTVTAAIDAGGAAIWGSAVAVGLIAIAGWLGFALGRTRRNESATGQTAEKSKNSHDAGQNYPEMPRKNNGDGVTLRATDSQLNLTEVIHQSAEAIIVTDTKFKVRYANPAVTTILGYAPQNLSGKKVDVLISKINERAILEDMSFARSKSLHWSGRVIGKKVDGVPLEMEMDISPIRDAENKIVAFTHLMYDISMKTQMEEQVRQSVKMQAVGRLAGGIAHDFNNHLTVIKGYCDLLTQESQQDDSSLDCIEQISWATKQATELTGSLLAFSRKKVLKPSLLNPAATLREMEKPLAVLGEDITLTIKTPEDAGSICVDTVRFQQTIMNLATNARDAMGGAGQLTIEVSNVDLDRDHERSHPEARSGQYVLLSFTDTGSGMDSETLSHVFEPFFTTKSKGKGTGLGLAMVYSFVKQSGGHIDISSEKGIGTTFRLYIPQAESTVEEGTEIMDTHPTEKRPRKILLVEDDHAVRRLVARVLVEDGYSVIETGDPTEAAGLMRQSSQPIDLLVSDVVMPEMNGPEMAQKLRKTDPNLKVLFMSGFSEETVISQGVPSNMEHFLHKPFTPQQICKKIADVLTESSAPPQGTYESEKSLQQAR